MADSNMAPAPIGVKFCRKCASSLPTSNFSRCSRAADGLQFRCKACCASYGRENAERRAAVAAAYYAENKERSAVVGKIWREANKDRRAVVAARRYARARESVLAKNKEWLEQNRAAARAIHRKWAAANPDAVRANRARTRSQQRKATPLWANHLAIVAIYAEAAKLTRRTGIQHEVDHVVPLRSKVVCGLHCEANLRIIHASENRKKGNKWTPGATLEAMLSPLTARASAE